MYLLLFFTTQVDNVKMDLVYHSIISTVLCIFLFDVNDHMKPFQSHFNSNLTSLSFLVSKTLKTSNSAKCKSQHFSVSGFGCAHAFDVTCPG